MILVKQSEDCVRNVNTKLTFLCAFTKLRKRLVDSLFLSVCIEQLGYHWADFHKILCLRTFRKSVQKIQVSLKSDSNEGYSAWRRTYISVISRSLLLRMRNVSDKLCIQNQNTHFVVSNIFFFFENRTVYEIIWKHFVHWQVTDDNMAHAHCMLDT